MLGPAVQYFFFISDEFGQSALQMGQVAVLCGPYALFMAL